MLSQLGESPPDRPDRSRRAGATPGDETGRAPEAREEEKGGYRTTDFTIDPVGSEDGPDSGSPTAPTLSRYSRADGEDEHVLRELDRLRDELAPRRGTTPRPVAEEPPPAPNDAPEGRNSAPWGEPSPYLEERITVARTAVSELVTRSQGVEEELDGLRHALAMVDREIDRASAELGFIQSNPWDEGAGEAVSWRVPTTHPLVGEPPALPPPAPVASKGVIPPDSSIPPLTGSYEDFTVERYNRTVSKLHDRRLALGWGTVAAAVAISSSLLWLTLQAHEPVPPIWLAVLPLVWMVPVPFFVAAFRGTQRVLRENRLELSEET